MPGFPVDGHILIFYIAVQFQVAVAQLHFVTEQ